MARVSQRIRAQVAERAGNQCEYCLSPDNTALHTFECEHIIPSSKNGSDAIDNLAWSCGGCNRKKSARLTAIGPVTNEAISLYHPRNDKWNNHFVWDDNYLEIVGLTAIGRATIKTLQLNRSGVVNIRRLLRLDGIYPSKND